MRLNLTPSGHAAATGMRPLAAEAPTCVCLSAVPGAKQLLLLGQYSVGQEGLSKKCFAKQLPHRCLIWAAASADCRLYVDLSRRRMPQHQCSHSLGADLG